MERHLYSNIDINTAVTPFLRAAAAGSPDPSVLYPFVDLYEGTAVTDVLFCVFCQYSATDSEWWTCSRDKFRQKEENGVPVDYTAEFAPICAFLDRGIDPYEVWFRRCREKGLRPWLSVRMNDCHCNTEDASFLRSDFHYEALKNGWMAGEDYGYYHRCFDYAVPEVRRRMLGYLEEQLSRYDVDGLELDFQRELVCFDYLRRSDCAGIMNGFIRSVRAAVRRAEVRLGHPVRLGVRIMQDVEMNLVYGFDAETWVREGLVDLLVPSPRWESNDTDLPVSDWKRRFPDTEIAAGITDLFLRNVSDMGCTPALVRGCAVRFLSDGADSVYLYNFQQDPNAPDPRFGEMNRTCADLETASSLPRRYMVTWQDSVPLGMEGRHPLPLRNGAYTVRPGPVPAGRRVAVLAALEGGDPAAADLRVNGLVLPFLPCDRGAVDPEKPDTYVPEGSRLYRAELPAGAGDAFTVSLSGAASLTYLEAEVF